MFGMLAAGIQMAAQRGKCDDSGPYYFSHGDLHGGQIKTAKSNGVWQISGIIDWELAGWWPEAWESQKIEMLASGKLG